MPIDDILSESNRFISKNKTNLTARLLMTPPGSLTCRERGENVYCYLRQYASKASRKEIYLGKPTEKTARFVSNLIKSRADAKRELNEARHHLKKLGESAASVEREDFTPLLKDLIRQLGERSLFDAGLSIVGSWCFHIYQAHFGVEYYPLRTLDFDLCIKLPYVGDPTSMAEIFRNLGFAERFDYETHSVSYTNADMVVEILADRKGSGRGQSKAIKDLEVAPLYLPYLGLLTDNPVTVRLRGLGTVTVPSMPAFFVHKILVGGIRKNPAKKEKDFIQAYHVCKRLRVEEALAAQTADILTGLSKGWTKTFRASLGKLAALLPAEAGEIHEFLNALVQ